MTSTRDEATFESDSHVSILVPSAVVQLVETPHLFLICSSPHFYRVVPKRALAVLGQADEFHQVVRGWATKQFGPPVDAVP